MVQSIPPALRRAVPALPRATMPRGRPPKGRDAVHGPTSIATAGLQASLHSFFSPSVATVFQQANQQAAARTPQPSPPLPSNAGAQNEDTEDEPCMSDTEDEDVEEPGTSTDTAAVTSTDTAAETTDADAAGSAGLDVLSEELRADLKQYVQTETKSFKRRVWENAEKEMVLRLLAERNNSKHGTVNFLQKSPLFQHSQLRRVTRKMLIAWSRAWANNGKSFKRRGKQRNADFEAEVLSECLVMDWAKGDGTDGTADLVVVGNDLHSYAIVQTAAKAVQAKAKWENESSVARLKFGCTWVHSFLHRYGMRRKRVTAAHKGNRPSDEEIQSVMEGIQRTIVENRIPPKFTLNTDETGVFYGQGPKLQWVPEGSTHGGVRASQAFSDMKDRFTANLTGSGEGDLLPEFQIIYCSVSKPDMSRVKVIDNLHKQQGFQQSDGWTQKWWTRTLPIKQQSKKGEPVRYEAVEYTRPYLQHSSGTVVTCQNKAWMDTPAICMWVDLVLAPWLEENECPEWGALLTWDHCGPHKTRAVEQVLAEHKIWAFCLPKNMTDFLQVMDLVVNGPYKSNTRRFRLEDLHTYM